jgi:hypothetical protein
VGVRGNAQVSGEIRVLGPRKFGLTGAATPTSTKETVMNPARAPGRLARLLAALAAAALAVTVPTAAALATPRPRPPGWNKHPPVPASTHPAINYHPPGWNKHPPLHAHVHALATGGMPGWQIALIAAAVLASAAAVALLARARAARRRTTASPA